MNDLAAIQEFKQVEKEIKLLKTGFATRQLELLSKEENELTRREKAELARYDSELADLKKKAADWMEIIKKGVERVAFNPNLQGITLGINGRSSNEFGYFRRNYKICQET